MFLIRRMLRIQWKTKAANEIILIEAVGKRTLVNDIGKKKETLFGHVMRRRALEHLAITGHINGRRSRGRQRIKIMDDLRI